MGQYTRELAVLLLQINSLPGAIGRTLRPARCSSTAPPLSDVTALQCLQPDLWGPDSIVTGPSSTEDVPAAISSAAAVSTSLETVLEEVRINNFALVANQIVYFKRGLNVVTGESGSGKSVLVSSLACDLPAAPHMLN